MNNIKLKNIVITGGAGFIGSNFVEYMQEKIDGTIYVVDTFGKSINNCNTHGTFHNLVDLNCVPIAGDIRDIKELITDSIKTPIDAFFHLAAISDTTATDQNTVMDVNLNSFFQIQNICDSYNSPLIYASSGAVYGNEIQEVNNIGSESPNNVYGYSKYSMDKISASQKFRTPGGNPITGLRFFNVYGPRESYKGKAASMILQLYHQLKKRVFVAFLKAVIEF